MHPGCVGIFAFDNSTSHGAFADDALIAKHMNLKPGGKQHKLRDTVFNNQVQKMVFSDGQPKGMRIVLQERNLWRDGLRAFCDNDSNENNDCCARHILEAQPDFLAQKPLIQEIIEQRGHKVIFYPKFHCELNFIERYWGEAKRYARNNCDYSWNGLKTVVPKALDSVSLEHIRKYARHSFHYMDAYRNGLTGEQAKFAIKQYKSHRKVTHNIFNNENNE
jgi:hypothetical protein